MKNLALLYLSLVCIVCHAQTTKIRLNEDGTQSTVIKNGNITTLVNQDGSQTTLVNSGNSSTIANTDGTSTVFMKAGNMTTIVKSNGAVTSLIDNGTTFTISQDGKLTSVPKNETVVGFTGTDGTKYRLTNRGDGYTVTNLKEKFSTLVNGDGVATELIADKATFDNIKKGNTSKIINPDGSYTLVTRDGNSYKATTQYTTVKDGNTSTIKNPDGTEVTTVDPNAPPAVTKNLNFITTTDQNGAPAIGVAASYAKAGKVVSHYSSTTTTTDDRGNPPNNLAEKAMANYLARPNVDYAVVANESAPGMSKFEINLYSDKRKLQKGDFIWLSLKSSSVKDLTDGTYIFSMKNANTREPFNFYGSVATAGIQDPIKEGSFTIKKTVNALSIDFTLKLLSGKSVTGKYTGKYKTENRSTNID